METGTTPALAADQVDQARETIVSLGELAAIPGVPSEPTLRKLIDECEDFPLVSRGTNGSAYEIPLERFVAWFKARRQAEEEAERRRKAELRQYGLELLGEGAASAATSAANGLSATDQKALLEAEILAIRVGRERGELVRKAEVEAAIGELAGKNRRRWLELSSRLAKRADVSRETLAELDRLVATVLDECAGDWEALGRADTSISDDRAD